MAAHSGREATRPAIGVAMAEPERMLVVEALTDAGFDATSLTPGASLAEATAGMAGNLILVVDVAGDPEAAVTSVTEARASHATGLSVLFVATDAELDGLGAAGLSDGDELLLRPFDVDALRWRVEAMAIRAVVPTSDASDAVLAGGPVDADWAPSAPVYAVFNPKGGVGKTTVATNLAAVLQVWKGLHVLLLDADTVTGHVGLSLGLPTGRAAADSWADEDAGYGHETLLDLSARHSSGIRVASLATNPLTHPNLVPSRVADAIMEARQHVDAIVVDLHPSYSEVNLAIFAIADRILVPVTPDLPAMRAAIQMKEVAAEIGVRDRLAMIINRANSGVTVADMEATVGLPAMAQIRSAGLHFVWSSNAGKTLIEKFPKHAVAQDFEHLADRLVKVSSGAANDAKAKDQGNLLRGLFGRKPLAET